MQTADIRDARFYVVDERNPNMNVEPLGFDDAFRKASSLSEQGGSIRVMYTDEASQMQLTRFAEAGIRAGLVPQG
jgi:hypothetical protein